MKAVPARYTMKLVLPLLLLVVPGVTRAQQQPTQPLSVQVTHETIRLGLPRCDQDARLIALACYESADAGTAEVWRGRATGQAITIPRVDESGRDRLYDRFMLTDLAGHPLGPCRYADQLDDLPAPSHVMDWPAGIKGVQAPLIWGDLTELGAAHITINISICPLLEGPVDGQAGADELTYTVDGVTYRFNADVVRRLDEEVIWMTGRGINCIGIILCYVPREGQDNPLVYPGIDLRQVPNNLTAVNLTTAEGERRYRAVMGFLGRRYSRADKKYGRIGGYVIGNEVQSHWHWHNMGEQPAGAVIRQYTDQVRLSYYALREHHRSPRVFASFDHFWAARHGDNPLRAVSGRAFLDAFAVDIRDHGDLPWHVAWHPYPENLFDPAFWDDATAWFAYDTPRVTYRNIEVLVDYLQRDELRYKGASRRVILSEQGFHAGDSAESEQLQAAAYAAAHVRVSAIDGIDAHILHRHTDHPHEGGLKLGLRRCDAAGRPTGRRPIFDVFAAAGTDQQDEAFGFALPVIGVKSWELLLPRTGPFPEHRP